MPTTGERNDPLAAFRFAVRFGPGPIGPTGGFTDCTGLGSEVQIQEYLEGGRNSTPRKFVTRTTFSDVVLKRGIVDPWVWTWHFMTTQGIITRLDVSIVVHNEAGDEAMAFTLRRAFPKKWSGPDLNAGQNSIAMESLELSHEGLLRTR